MTCSGCSGAVERVLKKTEGASYLAAHRPRAHRLTHRATGVSSYDISLEKQEVIVKGSIGYELLLEKIKKTGKEVRAVGLSQDCEELTDGFAAQVRSGETVV